MNEMTTNAWMQLEAALVDEPAVADVRLVAAPIVERARSARARLSEAEHNDTADLIARMADRLMRQETMLAEERARSAELERRFASSMAVRI